MNPPFNFCFIEKKEAPAKTEEPKKKEEPKEEEMAVGGLFGDDDF